MKHQSWCTPAHTLNALEVNWARHHRQPEECLEPQAMFYVTFALSAYMTPLWDQIREISYLAISEDAIDSLRQHTKCSRPGPRDVVNLLPEEHPIIGLPALEEFCDRVRSASIVDNLGAAMSSALLEAITSNGSGRPQWQVETNMGSTLGFKSSNYSHGRTVICSRQSILKTKLVEESLPSPFFAPPSGTTDNVKERPHHSYGQCPKICPRSEMECSSQRTLRGMRKVKLPDGVSLCSMGL
jgi:hypothetical protein